MKKKLNEELKNEEMMDGTKPAKEAEEEKISLWKELLSWVEIIVVAVLISLFLGQCTGAVLLHGDIDLAGRPFVWKPAHL